MDTDLDLLHDLELDRCVYDGQNLEAEVSELVVGYGGCVVRGPRRYSVRFARPVAHTITEELPAAFAALFQGGDRGFLRDVEAPALRVALGLDLKQLEGLRSFALVTAHEVLVAYCSDEPVVEERGG